MLKPIQAPASNPKHPLYDAARDHLLSRESSALLTRLYAKDSAVANFVQTMTNRDNQTVVQYIGTSSPSTLLHSLEVALVCQELATHLGQPAQFATDFTIAALCHDIGKAGDSTIGHIIDTPRQLDMASRELVDSHAELGESYLRTLSEHAGRSLPYTFKRQLGLATYCAGHHHDPDLSLDTSSTPDGPDLRHTQDSCAHPLTQLVAVVDRVLAQTDHARAYVSFRTDNTIHASEFGTNKDILNAIQTLQQSEGQLAPLAEASFGGIPFQHIAEALPICIATSLPNRRIFTVKIHRFYTSTGQILLANARH